MYSAGDVSIIIPTYNREEDLRITIINGIPFLKQIRELIIVDQSANNRIKKFIFSIRNKKIKYHHRKTPSLTAARNFGIGKAKGEIVLFLDDDVTLDKNYLENILEVFNCYNGALGVAGFQNNSGKKGAEHLARKLFLLENSGINNADVKSAYGAIYPSVLNKIIKAMWLTGYNMAYKKEVFRGFRFDENLSRYALAEDFDFSYRIWKKNPGSLFMTPRAGIVHRFSSVGREPTKKAAYMNQINHFYLNYKNFNSNVKEKIIFIWNLIGLSMVKIANFLISRKKEEALKMKFFFLSLIYCMRNKRKIKNGNLSEIYL